MLASLRFLVRSKRLFLSLNASVRTRTGRFCVPVITKRKESHMCWFAFLFSTRFWIAVWILVLFVGLLPLPPAAELVILVAFSRTPSGLCGAVFAARLSGGHLLRPKRPKRRSTAGCVAGGPPRVIHRCHRCV